MASFSRLDDTRMIRMKVDEKAHDLFKEKPGQAPMTVTRIFRSDKRSANFFERNREILDLSDIKRLHNLPNETSQIFTITQDRSWTTLNTSREAFEGFISTYEIFPSFWRYMFTFGRKSEENEFEFPRFGQRRIRDPNSDSYTQGVEFAYMLRRVELKNREVVEGDSPWSIRQTAVYNKLHLMSKSCEILDDGQNSVVPVDCRSTLLLISPSGNVELQFAECLEQAAGAEESPLSLWNTHRILILDSLRGWMNYMAYLEQRLKHQSDEIVLATVGTDKVNFSPLTDFKIDFEDRQELKIIEDFVLDLQIILPGILDAITGVRDQCREYLTSFRHGIKAQYEMEAILGELNEYIREVTIYIERAKNLKDKANSTAQLLSDLLSYEENVALKGLATETQLESRSMCQFTERSTKDAAAVKILTVITLIYLPTTIVANFFSTQFVQTSSDGQMRVSNKVWLLAAISVPLTFFTILLWWSWVRFTKLEPAVDPEQPGIVTLQRAHSFRSIVSTKKKQKDLENGLASPRTPSFRHARAAPTWASNATTVKAE
ncbi:hypothetical protein N431DRAFT_194425 [Stipitochalara longipes BDJ]|nr:hypothetical protein N431DRAFT_194425 [Stipitochalara longipes BDJ]